MACGEPAPGRGARADRRPTRAVDGGASRAGSPAGRRRRWPARGVRRHSPGAFSRRAVRCGPGDAAADAAAGLAPAGFAGRIIGAYRLVSPIGQGGMGIVWLAERCDGQFEARAAVKLLRDPLRPLGGPIPSRGEHRRPPHPSQHRAPDRCGRLVRRPAVPRARARRRPADR